jgi:hypothetical protein
MKSTRPSFRPYECDRSHSFHDEDRPDLNALIEENQRLRETVVQLSRLVLRNVVDQHH